MLFNRPRKPFLNSVELLALIDSKRAEKGLKPYRHNELLRAIKNNAVGFYTAKLVQAASGRVVTSYVMTEDDAFRVIAAVEPDIALDIYKAFAALSY